jgi:hypothetical protein
MSDPEPSDVFRRVSRRNRKRAINTRQPLFPPEDDLPLEAPVKPPPPAAPPTPPAERFPPLDLNAATQPKHPPAPEPAPRARNACLPNLVALFFCAATVTALGWVALVTADPYTRFNPFPPFTPFPIVITATSLPTTPGPTPTFTPLALEAATEDAAVFPFTLRNASVLYQPNGNGKGCDWASIAGTVSDVDSKPLSNYAVRVVGAGRDEKVFSGSALTFGAGGFELFLNGAPLAGDYTVQLYSAQGEPLSEVYTVTTRTDCQQNVAVVNFVRAR